MPKTENAPKPVRSFRLSPECMSQLKEMKKVMGRSESDVIEVALDRMYREEIRFNHVLREKVRKEDEYKVKEDEGDYENNSNWFEGDD